MVCVCCLRHYRCLCPAFSERGRVPRQRKEGPAIVSLVVGESLRLGTPHVGLDTLLVMLRQFGLPTAVAIYFKAMSPAVSHV